MSKGFTISNVNPPDITRFKEISKKYNPELTASKTFTFLLDLEAAAPKVLTNNNPDVEDLEKMEALQKDLEQATATITEQKNQINTLTDLLASAQVKKQANEFTVNPSAELSTNMRRVISFLIKNNRLNRHEPNLPEAFTIKAIEYLIKNEYRHVLK